MYFHPVSLEKSFDIGIYQNMLKGSNLCREYWHTCKLSPATKCVGATIYICRHRPYWNVWVALGSGRFPIPMNMCSLCANPFKPFLDYAYPYSYIVVHTKALPPTLVLGTYSIQSWGLTCHILLTTSLSGGFNTHMKLSPYVTYLCFSDQTDLPGIRVSLSRPSVTQYASHTGHAPPWRFAYWGLCPQLVTEDPIVFPSHPWGSTPGTFYLSGDEPPYRLCIAWGPTKPLPPPSPGASMPLRKDWCSLSGLNDHCFSVMSTHLAP